MPNFTIIIPVFEETDALSFSKFYFDALEVKPIYALDSKRSHRRGEVEALLGRAVSIYENPGSCIEANYGNLASLAPTEWVLRVDCDEVPNSAMLKYCRSFVENPKGNYCGFDRDDVIWRDGAFERLVYAPLFVDTQFRLFNRNKVKFISKIHTPGFYVPKWKLPFWPRWNAPMDARLYHLQRIFISRQQREEKKARYDGAGQGAGFSEWLSRPDESFKWKPLRDETFARSFAAWRRQD
jgi:hypothetical protein